MKQSIDLKELERKAFRATFQDGLLDMFIGVAVVAFAVIPLLEGLGDFWSAVAFLPIYGMAWLGFRAAKRGLTLPRMGAIRPGPARRERVRKTMAAIAVAIGVVAVLGLAVIALQQGGAALADWLFPALLGLLALTVFSVAAHLLDLPRLYAYGVLVGLAAPVGEILYRRAGASHHGWPITFAIAGGTIFVAGVVMLLRFLRAYPVVREGEP
jgi:hypothetical protein